MESTYTMPEITEEGLPEQARDILAGIRTGGGEYVKRAVIADYLGKTRLSDGDITTLNFLVALGFVDVREVDTYAPSGIRYEYRVKG